MKPTLVLFARAPLPGNAKTRLAEAVGPAAAAAAYAEILDRLRARLCRPLQGWEQVIFVARESDRAWFARHWPEMRCEVQVRGDLGDRLRAAFEATFARGHERVVVVGTDIPDLAADHVRRAGRLLERVPLVLGPCEDGGYYLIGQRAPGADLFSGIAWSTERVYRQTLERALAQGLAVGRLPTLYDVDTVEDLRRFWADQAVAARGRRAASRS